MLDKLKIQYAYFLNDLIRDYGRGAQQCSPTILVTTINKMYYYSCVLNDVLGCKTAGDLHSVVMALRFTDQSLHENMWLLYKKEFKHDTGLAAQLTAAYAISDAQIRTARALSTDKIEMPAPSPHPFLEPELELELEARDTLKLKETPPLEDFISPAVSPIFIME